MQFVGMIYENSAIQERSILQHYNGICYNRKLLCVIKMCLTELYNDFRVG